MRFPISYNAFSRVILTIIGIPQRFSYVDVSDGRVQARMGWSGTITMRRDAIARVKKVDRVPLGLGLGIHGNMMGTWAMNGASSGAVKITMSEPASGRVLFIPIKPSVVYLSLDDPAGFVAALND